MAEDERATDPIAGALAALDGGVAHAYPDRENRLEDMVFTFQKRAREARAWGELLARAGLGAPGAGAALDVGAGLGAYVEPLATRFARAYFVDADPVRIAALRARHPGAAAFVVDVVDEGLAAAPLTGAFRLVQCVQVLGHVPCDVVPTALARLAGLVAPGGHLLFAVPFTGAPFDDFWITFLDGDAPRPMPTDVRKFDRLARAPQKDRLPVRHFALETVHALVAATGLEVQETRPYNWFSDVRGDLFVLARRPGGGP